MHHLRSPYLTERHPLVLLPAPMPASFQRRVFLLATATVPMLSACAGGPTPDRLAEARVAFTRIETAADGRLGVCAFRADGGPVVSHRGQERFPACSTFKTLAAAAVLARSDAVPGLLERVVRYGPADMVAYSPVTSRHGGEGMTYAALCAAALQYSDNTAGNLLLREIGGPAGLTRYVQTLGDPTFRLDRWETALNDAVPGDLRDTCTPDGMARSLQRLLLGDSLAPAHRARLVEWMRGNTTGDARLRAGVPAGWPVADKTGSGDYGTVNDVGVAWPPAGSPLVIAVYFTRGVQPAQDAPLRHDVVADATRAVVRALAG